MDREAEDGEDLSAGLILFVGLIYTFVAADQTLKGNTGMGMAFAGYAFSNLGLFMLSK